MDKIDYTEFANTVKKAKLKRKYKISGSIGIYDAFKYYRKNKPSGHKYIMKDVDFYKIINGVNNKLINQFLEYGTLKFLQRMGGLEVRSYKIEPKIDSNNKLIFKAPIDWISTLHLWYEDEDAMKNKLLVKRNINKIYRIIYNRKGCNYNNKSIMSFKVCRSLKQKLSKSITSGSFKSDFEFDNNI